jgi:PPOX class probable F420-dependent enzyme
MAATIPDSHRDLLDAPVATLATISPDGRPQVTGVWFLAEEGTIKISLNRARRKVRNLQRHAECGVLIYDPATPYRYLEIRGDARLLPDDDYEFANRLGAKYNTDVRGLDGPGESRVVAVVEPTTVNAVDLTPYF